MTREQWRQDWHDYRHHWHVVQEIYSAGDPDIPQPKVSPEAWRVIGVLKSPVPSVSNWIAEYLKPKRPDLYLPF